MRSLRARRRTERAAASHGDAKLAARALILASHLVGFHHGQKALGSQLRERRGRSQRLPPSVRRC